MTLPEDEKTAIPATHQVRASVGFLRDLNLYNREKPFHLDLSKDREADSFLTNIVHDVYDDVIVTDIRGNEGLFNLDIHGFQLAKHITSMHPHDFDEPEKIRAAYFPEMASYLKTFLGAKSVQIMQSITRQRGLNFEENGGRTKLKTGRQPPIPAIHIGRSPHQI